jgi:3-oxoacyl-ACP reductase-like protein
MSIFSSIMDKIFHAAPAVESAIQNATAPAPAETNAPATAAAPNPAVAATPAAPSQPVDVEAVLTQMASQKGGGGNWQTSIVDLLKLLDLDSSLDARKQLAGELNVHVGADGTAEENVALHKAVMQKLAENGGKVPDSLKG